MLSYKGYRFFLLFILIFSTVFIKAQQKEIKNVLYINSYGVTYSWGDSIAKGVIETFKKRPDIILYVEYLDTKRFGTTNISEYYQLFRKKYKNKKFDVVIASDNAAMEFLIQYSDSLIPNTNVAFCGINNPEDYNLENTSYYGIKEGVDLDLVIHLVLTVMPGLKNLYFITDSTATSLTNLLYARKLEPKYKNTVKFRYISHISVDSLYKISDKFEEESAIVLFDIFQDIDKTPVNSDIVVQNVASKCNIPIFMDSETSFGKGIAGGIINNGNYNGQSVANLALQMIDNPQFVPMQRISSPVDRYCFDYAIIKKYGINPDLLPEGSIVIHGPENFLKKYSKYIAVFLIIILILIITNSILIININKRKKAEKLLRESENKLKEAQQIVKVGHWHFHFKSNVFYWSDEVYRIFGQDKKTFEPLLDKFMNCVHVEDKRIVLEILQSAWTQENELEIIYRIYSGDGNLKYLAHKFIALPENKNEVGLYGTIQDITQKKLIEIELENHRNHLESLVKERTAELENTTSELQKSLNNLANQKEELNQTIEQLNNTREQLVHSEKLASLGVFTAGIAHEINNPINYISSGIFALFKILDSFKLEHSEKSQILSKNLSEIETIKSVIEKGIEKTTAIVSSLRNYAHSGNDTFVKYDVVVCMKDALILLNSTFENRIEIIENYFSPIEIECIPGKLNQVFVNLINNAVQSITGEGKIFLNVNIKEKDWIEIEIKDTGYGIEENNLNRIFDPFFTTKETGKGTGLGLYIVHGIIKQHKGTIKVESKPGKGTVFNILLPSSHT